MKRSITILMGILVGIVMALTLASQASAQEKKGKKEERLAGTVHMINKDTSTITIRRGNLQRQVVYSADTKFTYRNKPGTLEDVKDGRRVICLGMYDEKTRLMASRVDVREGK